MRVSCLPAWKVVDLLSESQKLAARHRAQTSAAAILTETHVEAKAKAHYQFTEKAQIRLDLCCLNTGVSSALYQKQMDRGGNTKAVLILTVKEAESY